jgi:ribulose-phosphate 3-epimerase
MAARKLARVPWRDWMRELEVEPSLYAADFSRLGEQIETLMRAGARIFHFDVGDGHFVPPITVGPIVLQSISPLVHRLGGRLDCHLMVEEPQRHFEAIAQAGGDGATFHIEAVDDPAAVAHRAREHELEVGLAFKPETEPEQAADVAEAFDIVLCMSIEPGYSGQPFMPEALPRIERLRGLIREDQPIQVDGGVGRGNIRLLRDAGARLFVAGTSVFGQDDIARAYGELVAELE